MKIILAPAKKMINAEELLPYWELPEMLDRTEEILAYLRSCTRSELQVLWKCNDRIADENFSRLLSMDLRSRLTPAVLAYVGIAYQYMAPSVFKEDELTYIQEHLRILSGFYGLLRPMDGVTPYRLEMQAKASVNGTKDLYSFWGDRLYRAVIDESRTIVNLASKEYSACIEKYLMPADRYIDVVFCEESGGKTVTKGTYAKMARGEMVRYMAEHRIEEVEKIKNFDRLGYTFHPEMSTETSYVFVKT